MTIRPEMSIPYRSVLPILHSGQPPDLYKTVIENIDDAVIVCDAQFYVTLVNNAAVSLYGYSEEEVLGKQLNEIIQPDFFDFKSDEVLQRLRTARSFRTELLQVTKTGQKIIVDSTAKVMPDEQGNPIGYVFTNRDITDAKNVQKALHEADTRYRKIVELAQDGIFTLSGDGIITFINQRGAEMLGFQPREIAGRNVRDFVFPEDIGLIRADLMPEEVCRGPKERRVRRKDGDILWAIFNGVSVTDQNGIDSGIMGTFTNITDMKVRECELQALADRLQKSNKELEKFAYVASHDLREPLRTIMSFSQLLEERYYQGLDSDAREFMGFIVDGARRMNSLIDDLLEYSRISSRGAPFTETDLNWVLRDTRKAIWKAIEEKNVTLTWDDLPTLYGDSSQIGELFQNLISNAIKYSSTDKRPEIHIRSVQEKPGEWTFSVMDNGIGIAPKYHQQIFEIFKRLHTREQYSGTGIGLAICQKIVERHGGSIWVESREGEGSTFFFTLPENADMKFGILPE